MSVPLDRIEHTFDFITGPGGDRRCALAGVCDPCGCAGRGPFRPRVPRHRRRDSADGGRAGRLPARACCLRVGSSGGHGPDRLQRSARLAVTPPTVRSPSDPGCDGRPTPLARPQAPRLSGCGACRRAPVAAGLAAGGISPSVAREILDWTDNLPDEHQGSADQACWTLLSPKPSLSDLSALAEELFRRCARPDADDGDDSFARRRVRLTYHYQGHAHLDADLTPSAAAAVKAVLDSLGRKTGPEDHERHPGPA